MNEGLKLKIMLGITYTCLGLAFATSTYYITNKSLSSMEKRQGIEFTIKEAENFMGRYDKKWYFRPALFPAKLATEKYLQNHSNQK